jgi:hypothetical protein
LVLPIRLLGLITQGAQAISTRANVSINVTTALDTEHHRVCTRNISETRSVSIIRCKGGKGSTRLGMASRRCKQIEFMKYHVRRNPRHWAMSKTTVITFFFVAHNY